MSAAVVEALPRCRRSGRRWVVVGLPWQLRGVLLRHDVPLDERGRPWAPTESAAWQLLAEIQSLVDTPLTGPLDTRVCGEVCYLGSLAFIVDQRVINGQSWLLLTSPDGRRRWRVSPASTALSGLVAYGHRPRLKDLPMHRR